MADNCALSRMLFLEFEPLQWLIVLAIGEFNKESNKSVKHSLNSYVRVSFENYSLGFGTIIFISSHFQKHVIEFFYHTVEIQTLITICIYRNFNFHSFIFND